MSVIKLIWAFLMNLQGLVSLLKQIQVSIEEAQSEKKVKDGIKVINDAFKSKDANALRDLFNGKLRDK